MPNATAEPATALATRHVPVLQDEVLRCLAPHAGGRYIDCTVDGAGHAALVLERSGPDGQLLGLDADPAAIAAARARLAGWGARARLVHANFRDLAACARAEGFVPADGVLFDLGLSSDTLEQSGRGFSFQRDEPLDMRYDPTHGPTAAMLLARSSEATLCDIFARYGEERAASRLARAIVQRRQRAPLQTTRDLVAVVEAVLGPGRGRIHPATRVFQALRIAVNDELGALEAALPQAVDVLGPGGRLVVIAFHSLEDRIVKRFLQNEAGAVCHCPPGLPVCVCRREPRVRVLTPKPVTPAAAEVARNPRARSAKLRAAVRLPEPAAAEPSGDSPPRRRRGPRERDA